GSIPCTATSLYPMASEGIEPARGAERAARNSATLWSAAAASRAATAVGVIAEAQAGNSLHRHHPLRPWHGILFTQQADIGRLETRKYRFPYLDA
ncbi:MAG: hypothetical protein AABZ02_06160, partial [Bacteroidota bacterium]